MNVKKAIKSIAAVAIGAAMVGSTVLGAADLASYPSNMITDGAFNGKIVIGLNAKPQDVIAAIDIATSLQASSVKQTVVAGGASAASYSVKGGIQISKSNEKLNLGQGFEDVLTTSLSKTDMPDLLADGTVSDDDGTDYEFDQKISFAGGDTEVGFFRDTANDAFGDNPVVGVNMKATAPLTMTLTFKGDSLDATLLDDSETISMFGKEFTFGSGIAAGSTISLFASSSTETIAVGESKTVKIDGDDTTIEVLGGNTDASPATALIKVNGVTKSVEEGKSYSFSGKDVRIKNVFATTVPTDSIAVEVMVGSNEYVLPTAAAAPAWGDIQDKDGDTVDGLQVKVIGTSNTAISSIVFQLVPMDLENSAGDDFKYLLAGEDLVLPVFDNLKLSFKGVSPALDEDRSEIKFERSSSDFKLTFTTMDDDTLTVSPFETISATNFVLSSDFVMNQTTSAHTIVEKGDYFLLTENEGAGRSSTSLFRYKAYSWGDDREDPDTYVELENVGTGATYKIYGDEDQTVGTKVADSNMNLSIRADKRINISEAPYTVYTKDDVKIVLGTNAQILAAGTAAGETTLSITVDEDEFSDIQDEIAGDQVAMTVDVNSDEEFDFEAVTSAAYSVLDDASDVQYTLTGQGLYGVRDAEDKSYAKFYPTPVEMTYAAFLETEGASVSMSAGSASGVTTTTVNPIPVGVAISDEDAMGLIGKTNLIVVGGPVVNTVMAKLKNNPTSEAIAAEYKPGVGLVELYDKTNFAELGTKVALLVSGYEWADTQRAARAVAQHSDANFKGSAVEVHGTSVAIAEIKAVSE